MAGSGGSQEPGMPSWSPPRMTGTQVFGTSSTTFIGAVAEHWIRSRATRALTSTPTCDISILTDDLICSAKSAMTKPQ